MGAARPDRSTHALHTVFTFTHALLQDVLGPFVVGKMEFDGDPTEAAGGIAPLLDRFQPGNGSAPPGVLAATSLACAPH